MALFMLSDFVSIGTNAPHTATSWEVANDQYFTVLIDQSLNDANNLTSWHSPLRKPNGTGFYNENDNVYCRVKVHFENHSSQWYVLPVCEQHQFQLSKLIIVSKQGSPDVAYTSDELGLS